MINWEVVMEVFILVFILGMVCLLILAIYTAEETNNEETEEGNKVYQDRLDFLIKNPILDKKVNVSLLEKLSSNKHGYNDVCGAPVRTYLKSVRFVIARKIEQLFTNHKTTSETDNFLITEEICKLVPFGEITTVETFQVIKMLSECDQNFLDYLGMGNQEKYIWIWNSISNILKTI